MSHIYLNMCRDYILKNLERLVKLSRCYETNDTEKIKLMKCCYVNLRFCPDWRNFTSKKKEDRYMTLLNRELYNNGDI